MKRATYYYNVKERPDKYADLRKEIARIFEKNKGRYGYRRVCLQLCNEGYSVNHKTVAKLMNDAGLIVMTAFISPFRQDRQRAKEIIGDDSFFEVYVSTPLEECEKRDVKGLYQKARDGKIRAFTGISSPYEAPLDPDVTIDTSKQTIEESVDLILKAIEKKFGEA